jgi:hypothetical protein
MRSTAALPDGNKAEVHGLHIKPSPPRLLLVGTCRRQDRKGMSKTDVSPRLLHPNSLLDIMS